MCRARFANGTKHHAIDKCPKNLLYGYIKRFESKRTIKIILHTQSIGKKRIIKEKMDKCSRG